MSKFFISLVFSGFITSVALAHPLIVAERVPGLEIEAQPKTLIIDSSGEVKMHTLDFNLDKVRVEKLATLSRYTMKKLRLDIRGITENSRLVDSNEGGPECIDAPMYQVAVQIKGKAKTIYKEQIAIPFV